MCRTATYVLIASLLLVACGGPTLSVRHEDPGYTAVQVHVDHELVGVIDFGETLEVSLEPGIHYVQANPVGSDSNPWADPDEGWVVFVDRETQITLLPEWPSD